MKKQTLLIILGAGLLLSCQSFNTTANPATTTEADSPTSSEVAQSKQSKKQASFENFFNEFKTAILAGDKGKLQSLSYGSGLKLVQGEDYSITNEEVLALWKKTSVKNVDLMEDIPDFLDDNDKMMDFRSVYLSLGYDEELDTGSGYYFYFAKINGQYKFIGILAVG